MHESDLVFTRGATLRNEVRPVLLTSVFIARLLAPAINQAGHEIDASGHLANRCARCKRLRHNRLLLHGLRAQRRRTPAVPKRRDLPPILKTRGEFPVSALNSNGVSDDLTPLAIT